MASFNAGAAPKYHPQCARRPMWTMALHRDLVVEGTAIGRVERPRARRRLAVHFGGKLSQAYANMSLTLARSLSPATHLVFFTLVLQ